MLAAIELSRILDTHIISVQQHAAAVVLSTFIILVSPLHLTFQASLVQKMPIQVAELVQKSVIQVSNFAGSIMLAN